MRMILASETGAKLDSDVCKGGGSDDTAPLQRALDLADETHGVELVMDGCALVSGLRLHSNTTIRCLNQNCGFYLADHADSPILVNADFSKGEIRTRNITLQGGCYNGNSLNQIHHRPDHLWVTAMSFFGVEGLTIRDLRVRSARTFAIHLANWLHVNLENLLFEPDHFELNQNQDAIHVNGPGRFLTARNLIGFGEDDFFALNADDDTKPMSVSHCFGPWVEEGDITDVLVDGVIWHDTIQGIRLLSRTARLDRIIIRNVQGTCSDFALLLEPYCAPGSITGNYGHILLENIDVREIKPRKNSDFMMTVAGKVECLELRNVHRHNSEDKRPYIWVRDQGDVDQLFIDGFSVHAPHPADKTANHITIDGHIAYLRLSNANIYEGTPKLNSDKLLKVNSSAHIDLLTINEITTKMVSG